MSIQPAGALAVDATGVSHQLWMTNEVNTLIWPSTNGIGLIDEAAWKNTVDVALNTKNETGATIITAEPPATAYSNEYVQKALDELTADGVDVKNAGFTPITVTLKEGGNQADSPKAGWSADHPATPAPPISTLRERTR
jgi:hypothetical protein